MWPEGPFLKAINSRMVCQKANPPQEAKRVSKDQQRGCGAGSMDERDGAEAGRLGECNCPQGSRPDEGL